MIALKGEANAKWQDKEVRALTRSVLRAILLPLWVLSGNGSTTQGFKRKHKTEIVRHFFDVMVAVLLHEFCLLAH